MGMIEVRNVLHVFALFQYSIYMDAFIEYILMSEHQNLHYFYIIDVPVILKKIINNIHVGN